MNLEKNKTDFIEPYILLLSLVFPVHQSECFEQLQRQGLCLDRVLSAR